MKLLIKTIVKVALLYRHSTYQRLHLHKFALEERIATLSIKLIKTSLDSELPRAMQMFTKLSDITKYVVLFAVFYVGR